MKTKNIQNAERFVPDYLQNKDLAYGPVLEHNAAMLKNISQLERKERCC